MSEFPYMFDLARFHLGCIFVRLQTWVGTTVPQARLAGSVTRCQVYSAVYSALYTVQCSAPGNQPTTQSHSGTRALNISAVKVTPPSSLTTDKWPQVSDIQ